jgi:hypothetical protein
MLICFDEDERALGNLSTLKVSISEVSAMRLGIKEV